MNIVPIVSFCIEHRKTYDFVMVFILGEFLFWNIHPKLDQIAWLLNRFMQIKGQNCLEKYTISFY